MTKELKSPSDEQIKAAHEACFEEGEWEAYIAVLTELFDFHWRHLSTPPKIDEEKILASRRKNKDPDPVRALAQYKKWGWKIGPISLHEPRARWAAERIRDVNRMFNETKEVEVWERKLEDLKRQCRMY